MRQTPNLIIHIVGADGGTGSIEYGKLKASVIWSFGGGWDHVSIAPYKRSYTPSWEEMCKLKRMFFHPDEVVVQYHPAESEYINNMTNCLHLWRPQNVEIPTPPAIMVGIKDGMNCEDVRREIKKLIRRKKMSDCKWMQDEICVNADCPMCCDYCPVADTEGVCKFEDRGDGNGNHK